jgi:hypothetical protein
MTPSEANQTLARQTADRHFHQGGKRADAENYVWGMPENRRLVAIANSVELPPAFCNSGPTTTRGQRMESGEKFRASVQRRMVQAKETYDQSWAYCSKHGESVAFFNEMNSGAHVPQGHGLVGTTQPADVYKAGGPNQNVAKASELDLPLDSDDLEVETASSETDPQKRFDALVGLVSRRLGCNVVAAQMYAMGRYQKLARQVNIPGVKVNSSQGINLQKNLQ